MSSGAAAGAARFFERAIEAWRLRSSDGRERVVPVVVRHWGHDAWDDLTWKGFKARPGEHIVSAKLRGCGHERVYRRRRPPGSKRTSAPCADCRAGARVQWEQQQLRTRVRTIVLDLAGSATSGHHGDGRHRLARLEDLVDGVVAAIEARLLPVHSTRAEAVLGRIDMHLRRAGVLDEMDGDLDEEG